jgi:hypothetical protein
MSTEKSEDSGNYTEAVGTRLSPRTMRQFKRFKEEREVGNAEALRRLTREALEDTTAEDRQPARQLTVVFGLLYIVVYSFGNRDTLIPIFAVYIVAMLAWTYAPLYRDWQSQTDD